MAFCFSIRVQVGDARFCVCFRREIGLLGSDGVAADDGVDTTILVVKIYVLKNRIKILLRRFFSIFYRVILSELIIPNLLVRYICFN